MREYMWREKSNTSIARTPRGIATVTAGKVHFVKEDAADLSRIGLDEQPGPTSDVNMGRLQVGRA